MDGILDAAFSALGMAADVAGVPGLGAAAGILQGIKANCDKISANKVGSFFFARITSLTISVLRATAKDWLRKLLNCMRHLRNTVQSCKN